MVWRRSWTPWIGPLSFGEKCSKCTLTLVRSTEICWDFLTLQRYFLPELGAKHRIHRKSLHLFSTLPNFFLRTMVLRVTRFYTTFMWLALPLECAWKHSTKQIYGSILGFQSYFKIWVRLFPWADSRLHLQMFITYNSTWLSLVTPNRDLCALRHRSSFGVSSSVKQRATWNHCIDVCVTVLFIFEIFNLMITWGCGEITKWNADITPPHPWFNVYVC